MTRLDKELVLRNLIETRTKASELISKNKVFVNGKIISKSSYDVAETDQIQVEDNDIFKYVSRGGFKLEKALKSFNYDLKNKIVMDIGSSTGGFTDCCLQFGAKKVIAIDVGTDVMNENLRQDKRVELHENLNILNADEILFSSVELIVSDVSFISITKVIKKIASIDKKFDLIFLIKPQFECGREIATKYKGIILNKKIHYDILNQVISEFDTQGYHIEKLDYSPIKGGDGNIEYLAFFTNKNNKNVKVNIQSIINKAFAD